MAGISQSAFLQALGWATLNSFWQMALLWAAFLTVQYFFRLKSHTKYVSALMALGIGFAWFIGTFILYYQSGPAPVFVSADAGAPGPATWNTILSSASLAYLLLLMVPAYRLFRNWQYIEYLKKYGLEKSGLEYRLFVKKIAARLGIKKPVHVYISHLITSPVTIGYLKPIILLPVAALNGLNTQQVEAILLHELSHIRRYDYLINFIITLLHTLFYFNPFVKKFVSAIESEREKCCDELVLQFQYDKLSYASALLTLEKNASSETILVMAAADKKHLLHRIQKILGQEQKTTFSFHHFAGVMASFLLLILINSLFFVGREQVQTGKDISFTAFESPLYGFDLKTTDASEPVIDDRSSLASADSKPAQKQPSTTSEALIMDIPQEAEARFDEHVIPVVYDASLALVNPEEKAQVTVTLEATKKVLTTTQWQEVEKSIADGMNEVEKLRAKKEYLNEIEKIDWKNLETRLLTQYEQLDWANIQTSLGQALVAIKLDSVEKSYVNILKQIEKTEAQVSHSNCGTAVLPVPDASVQEIRVIKDSLRSKLNNIKAARNKKVISL